MPVSGAWAIREAAWRALGKTYVWQASAAQLVSVNTGNLEGRYKRLVVLLDKTASASIAGDTCDIFLDTSIDGATWLNAAHFPQILGNGASVKYWCVFDASAPGTAPIVVTSDCAVNTVRPYLMGALWRVRTVIVNGGGTHSFTYAVTAFGQL